MEKNYRVFDIMGDINDRLRYLRSQRNQLEETLAKMPEGSLLVAPGNTKNSFRFYFRKTPQDKMGEYLRKNDGKIKEQLAIKKYVAETLKNASKEIEKLEKIQQMNLQDSIIETYKGLNPGVKKLINPITVDDDTYIKMWRDISYEGLGFEPDDKTEFYSNLGERMRSKSEVAIANMLLEHRIPYKYECPFVLHSGKKLYPDFTILDVRRRRIIYWEHLGRMGDLSYVSKNLWKLDEYKRNGIYLGINLFISYESDVSPMGTKEPMRIIKAILED